jgi:hypothetical protein
MNRCLIAVRRLDRGAAFRSRGVALIVVWCCTWLRSHALAVVLRRGRGAAPWSWCCAVVVVLRRGLGAAPWSWSRILIVERRPGREAAT